MKVLVTGVNGQLGYDTADVLNKRGHQVVTSGSKPEYSGIQKEAPVSDLTYIQLDITDPDAVMKCMEDIKPDAVIHCAGWTQVDAAEDPENYDEVMAVNVGGTRNIAEAAKKTGAVMVYISTDYVFSGEGSKPWTSDETDFSPLNVYGRSKVEGEEIVRSVLDRYFIVRTSWVFGMNGGNFIKSILKAAEIRPCLTVVDDQIGTPTYTEDLALLIADMIETDRYGTYNATNSEEGPGQYISWADLAEEALRDAGKDTSVKHVTTKEYGMNKAERPLNSRLDKSKLEQNGFRQLPTWKDAVARFVSRL